MVLSSREKELAAVAISLAAGCKPCTDYHVKAARKAGAPDPDIAAAAATAFAVRRRATATMRRHASARLGEVERGGDTLQSTAETDRITALVSVGAAFAVNCVSSLEEHLALAASAGVSDDDIAEVVKLAVFIKQRAASHVERIAGVCSAKPAANP